MATQASTIEHILKHLGDGFETRAMFGEYALYCDGKVVALVCDNTLFVKILAASAPLEKVCEKGPAYPGSRDHYIVTDDDVTRLHGLSGILRSIAIELPAKKPKKPPARKRVQSTAKKPTATRTTKKTERTTERAERK